MTTYNKSLSIAEKLELYSLPVTESGCRVWLRCVSGPMGYGNMTVNKRQAYTHRLAWESRNGSIPAGMNVLHKCDVPSCINIEHLFLGTSADNNIDCTKKGRNMRNEKGMFASKRKSGAH